MTHDTKLKDFLERAVSPAIAARTGTDLSNYDETHLHQILSDYIPPNKIFLIDLHGLHIHDEITSPKPTVQNAKKS